MNKQKKEYRKDDKFLSDLGKAIAAKRKNVPLTQQQLANKLGLEREAIARIEIGGINSTICVIRDIALELNLNLDQLIRST